MSNMGLVSFKKKLSELWAEYFVYKDGCSYEKAYEYAKVNLSSKWNVIKEIDYIERAFHVIYINKDDEAFRLFFDRFLQSYDYLILLKEKYESGEL